jgi:hypothetical protein
VLLVTKGVYTLHWYSGSLREIEKKCHRRNELEGVTAFFLREKKNESPIKFDVHYHFNAS